MHKENNKKDEIIWKRKKCKSFTINIGDKVLKRNLKNINNIVAKTKPLWSGTYKVLDIDSRKKVTLLNIKTMKKLKQCSYKTLHWNTKLIQRLLINNKHWLW